MGRRNFRSGFHSSFRSRRTKAFARNMALEWK
jgi:hypothetical protein